MEETIVFQSSRERGEKILVPSGQLFFSTDLRVSMHPTHFTIGPGEYGPLSVTRAHLQPLGLPFAGLVEIPFMPVHLLASSRPFAMAGNGLN
jgi:hypothetical protein